MTSDQPTRIMKMRNREQEADRHGAAEREGLAALAEQLREYTAMKYAGDCKCGKCQLVPRALVERIYHTLNGTSLASAPTAPQEADRVDEEWER